MSENPFASRYKHFTTLQLVEVLESKREYTYPAIAAAQEELANRNTTQEEIAEAKAHLALKKQQQFDQQQKSKEKIDQIKNKATSTVKNVVVSPVSAEASSTDKTIRAVSIALLIFFAIEFLTHVDLLEFILTADTANWDASVIAIFLPMFLLLPGAFLFWKKKKAGWWLVAFDLGARVVMALAGALFFGTGVSGELLTSLLVMGGTLWVISTTRIREVYYIAPRHVITVLIASFAYVCWVCQEMQNF